MGNPLNQTFTCEGNTYVTTGTDILKLVIIIIIMLLIIIGNVCCLVVFNHPRTRRMFKKRLRYMMTSLCFTDLSLGLLVCPSTLYPALKHCWPFGEAFCKIEALLISALFHESTLNMVIIAVDRYLVIHSSGYNSWMTSRRFLCVIVMTWVVVFSTYAIVIFAGEQFYFDEIGINCEPFYENPSVTLSVISIFYFLPAAIFVFCYASIYRTATKQFLTVSADSKDGRLRTSNIRTSKFLAAITLGFFSAISPWTICTLIIVAAGVSLQQDVDFAVTWLAISNSFWNSLIYGVMNRKFRSATLKFFCGRWIARIGETVMSRTEDSKDVTDDSISNRKNRAKKRGSSNKRTEFCTATSTSCESSPRLHRIELVDNVSSKLNRSDAVTLGMDADTAL